MRAARLAILMLAAAVAGASARAQDAAEIVRAGGIRSGLCVHLDVTDGKLTSDLAKAGKFVVHGVAATPEATASARSYIASGNLHGIVTVEHGSLARLPYASNLVNLVVVEDAAAALKAGLSLDEVARVLCPGGVAYLGHPGDARSRLEKSGIKGFEVVDADATRLLIRKKRPAEMDDWTHWRHGPDGNAVSQDALVDIPGRLQWVADPTWARTHAVSGGPRAMVSAGGRFFYVYDAAPRGMAGPMRLTLRARNSFNGILLWERPIESDPDFDFLRPVDYASYYWYQRRCLVATRDRVYAVLRQNGPLVALDAADGKPVQTYDALGSPREVVYQDGKLVLVVHRADVARYGLGTLCCADAATGALLWKFDKDAARYPIVTGEQVFFETTGEVVCAGLADGKERWRVKKPDGAKVLCFHHDGRLFLKGQGQDLYALRAQDGRALWKYPYKDFNGFYYSDTDVYAVGGLVWVQRGGEQWAMVGIDPATGEERRRVDFPANYPKTRGHHRCHPNKATSRYFLLDTHGLDFVDWKEGRIVDLRTFRGACYTGLLPSDGLLFLPPNACQCNEYLRGFMALAPRGVAAPPEAELPFEARLEKGPAFGAPADARTTDAAVEWPSYRHDPKRSGGTTAAVSPELGMLWERTVDPGITGLTVAGGLAFLAVTDANEVRALDAGTGEPRWSFTAGGRVDGPPTVHEGLALFGCRDGWVYCLRAKDGALVWRFRAAPAERRIVAFGRVESAWPLHGSVLVQGGVAFFAAGRSSELDGGIHVYAADPGTGKILWHKQTVACLDETLGGKVYEGYPPVALNDVMIGGGDFVSIRTTGFDAGTGEIKNKQYAWSPRSGMLDANSWAGRMRWAGPFLQAEMLVFDGKRTFAFATKGDTEWPVVPGKGQYQLFAKTSWDDTAWAMPMSLRVGAMTLAADRLYVAGVPDAVDAKDYWGALEGRKGAELWTLSAADGRKLQELKLDSPPVFDGMAAAYGRLYLSTRGGKVLCLGGK